MYKYNFQERLSKLTTFDIIRVCKIFEMLQYSTTFFILIILLVYILNQYYYKYFKINNEIDKVQDRSNKNFILLISYLILDTFIIIVSVFYIRKIVLLFPSLPHLYYPKFIPYTTIHFTINVALIFILLTLLPEYKAKLEQLKLYLS
jgi:hypothetical protein